MQRTPPTPPQQTLLELTGLAPPPQPAAEPAPSRAGNLSKQFLFPPFTLFDARNGEWQARKRRWLATGLRSEVGRKDGRLYGNQRRLSEILTDKGQGVEWSEDITPVAAKAPDVAEGAAGAETGTSIFDPVLCELLLGWFCPLGGTVLDPFAGGSVRGAVTAACGRRYLGVDVRAEQVEANRAQWTERLAGYWPTAPEPQWVHGDSRQIAAYGCEADFILSCPPYGPIEVYSDQPDDLSVLEQQDFAVAHAAIIKATVGLLRPGRFAAYVVGNYRTPDGNVYDFVGDTVRAFEAAGAMLYNDAVLLTPVGTLPVRAGRQFNAGRKLGRTHQMVLVFVKGSWREASAVCGGMHPDPFEGAGA